MGSTNLVTEINMKRDLILDGGLTITKTNGLQTALDATAKLASFNSFTSNHSITGDLFVSGGAISNTATVLSTTPTLDGQLTSKLYVDTQVALTPKLASVNTFIANQNITGALLVSGVINRTGSSWSLGGTNNGSNILQSILKKTVI